MPGLLSISQPNKFAGISGQGASNALKLSRKKNKQKNYYSHHHYCDHEQHHHDHHHRHHHRDHHRHRHVDKTKSDCYQENIKISTCNNKPDNDLHFNCKPNNPNALVIPGSLYIMQSDKFRVNNTRKKTIC